MKRVFLSFAILLVAAAAVQAQKGFRLGAKVGANATKLDGQSFESGFNASWHAGAFVELDFTKKLGIQPELLWSQTKSTFVNNVNGLPSTLTTRDVSLNYLSIPLLLRWSPNKLITLNAGPQYSILMDQNKRLFRVSAILRSSQSHLMATKYILQVASVDRKHLTDSAA